jgi:hypothetical protein
MTDVVILREWDADTFHRRILEMEEAGYEALRESYRITAEMDPNTGSITHLHTIELRRVESPE